MLKQQQVRLLASVLMWANIHPAALAQTALPPNTTQTAEFIQGQITPVNQLADVRPTDWAFQALQSLVERYSCISGYPKQTFRGNQTLSRYEFAAGLNTCLARITKLLPASKKEDLEILHGLQEEFAPELATLRGRVDALESRTATLESQQFSTTTKLQGIVVMAANAGITGDRILDINGNQIVNSQPNPTVLYRASLLLDTSFSGTDLLRILVEAASEGIGDNTAGYLEPTLGSVLDYSAKPPTGNTFGLSRVFYTFKPSRDLEISAGPAITLTDFVDLSSYANVSFRDFSTLAFMNNYILFPINGLGAGGAAKWKPSNGAFTLSAAYVAAEAQNPGNQGLVRAINPISRVLYPNSRGESGLFGDTYQGVFELEYAPSKTFALRLQYAGGQVLDNGFDAIGANLEWTLSSRFGIFGRYGYSWYNNTVFGDLNPQYWMAGITVKDLFKPGALAGLAAGQPFVESHVGSGTQTNFEAFYRFPVNDNIHISPVVQVITHPGNQDANGTIFTGTLRTVFLF
jgi:Carbohydrate-selective porin, OprB family/S-layer homology domain